MATRIVDPPVVAAKEDIEDTKVDETQVGNLQITEENETHGELPTDDELHTLRRVSDKIPWRVYTIAFVELCERFSYYGTTVVCK
ncbi:hypothetical protein B0O99DRAFT_633429 [Bisporella sp. PMI_857]|nr:hypothetical protein B0O99DRAFT_633429 [Bisporella sp. PMI_857]